MYCNKKRRIKILPGKIRLMDHSPHSLVPIQPFLLWYMPQKIEEDMVFIGRLGLYMGHESWPASVVIATDGGVVGRVRMVVSPKVGLMSKQGKPTSK